MGDDASWRWGKVPITDAAAGEDDHEETDEEDDKQGDQSDNGRFQHHFVGLGLCGEHVDDGSVVERAQDVVVEVNGAQDVWNDSDRVALAVNTVDEDIGAVFLQRAVVVDVVAQLIDDDQQLRGVAQFVPELLAFYQRRLQRLVHHDLSHSNWVRLIIKSGMNKCWKLNEPEEFKLCQLVSLIPKSFDNR